MYDVLYTSVFLPATAAGSFKDFEFNIKLNNNTDMLAPMQIELRDGVK